jgi:hypothetical protein
VNKSIPITDRKQRSKSRGAMPSNDDIKNVNLSRKNSFNNHKSSKTELKRDEGEKKNDTKTTN